MGYYNNPVDSPEKYGVELVGTAWLSDQPYEFYALAVLKNDKGYYLSTDSGCSCPTPWESHTMDDFTGPLTAEQAREEATSLHEGAYDGPVDPERFADLLAKIN